MKKTVFKGTINGQEFDNVQDYNAKMGQLLAEGSPIDAHADTSTIETECRATRKVAVADLLPGTEKGEMGNAPYGSFSSAEDVRTQLVDKYHNIIVPVINDMDEDDLRHYREDVSRILQKIVNDLDAVQSELKENNEELESIGKKAIDLLKSMRTAQKVASDLKYNKGIVNVYIDLYDSIQRRIGEQLAHLQERNECNCEDCRKSSSEQDSVTQDSPGEITLADITDGLKKLCDEIFG